MTTPEPCANCKNTDIKFYKYFCGGFVAYKCFECNMLGPLDLKGDEQGALSQWNEMQQEQRGLDLVYAKSKQRLKVANHVLTWAYVVLAVVVIWAICLEVGTE